MNAVTASVATTDLWRPLALFLHSSRGPGELSQCFKHDDSTIKNKIIMNIIIIITGWPKKPHIFLGYRIFAATKDIIMRFLLKCSEITAENNK